MSKIPLLLWLATAWWMAATQFAVRNIDEPDFVIDTVSDWYVIRDYRAYIIAEVEISGKRKKAMNDWFRILAGYIFGWNTSKTSIEMTAPVNSRKSNEKIQMTAPVNGLQIWEDSHLVQFIMPSEYTIKSLPIPNDERIQFHKVYGHKKAVLRFTGYATEGTIQRKIKKLRNSLKSDEIEHDGKFSVAQYNPPLSFPFLRRNEILVSIEKE